MAKKIIPWFLGLVLVIGMLSIFLPARNSISQNRGPFHSLPGFPVDNFTLWDHRGDSHHLHSYSDARAIVLFTYGVGCPIARLSIVRMKELRDRYEPQGVKFLFLDSNPGDNRAALQKEAEEYGIDMPILIDESQFVTRALGISRTAEAIVIEPRSWKIAYRGAVDDRLAYEAQKERASNHYLADALDALLKNRAPAVAETPVKGCLIYVEPVQEDLTYVKDVAPILQKRCVECHYTGGSGPWAMDRYETVRNWGPMIRETVRTRRMPPRSLDPHYEKMKGTDWLSPEEARVIVDWVETGMTRGKGEDPLPAENQKLSETEWPWGEPDVILEAPTRVYIPATGWLDWQFDHLKDAIDRDLWVKAVYYKPSNYLVTHHGSVFSKVQCVPDVRKEDCVKNEFQRALASYTLGPEDRDAPDPWEKYYKKSTLWQRSKFYFKEWIDRFQKPEIYDLNHTTYSVERGAGYQFLGGYNLGLQVTPFPEGTGKFVPKGSLIRFLKHYKATGKHEEDTVRVGLYLYKDEELSAPVRPLHHIFIQANDFVIPAGIKNMKYSGEYELKEDILLYGSAPHLHYRGKSQKLIAVDADGKERILWSDPDFNYDFGSWEYRFEEPIQLPAGTVLRFEGIFDNSEANLKNPNPHTEARYGWQLDEEMFWVMIVYTTANSPV